jgi:HSP20 family molecular chaperone IbpA
MSSFYEKLSMKLQGGDEAEGGEKAGATSASVTYRATGDKAASAKKDSAPAAAQPAAVDKAPDGTDPIDVDLFQSDSRMVVFLKASGVPMSGFEITLSEESNTLTVEATQKRPALPAPKEAPKAGDPPEKGIYTKQEIKWKALYRKVYLPAPFDSGSAEAVLENGVLIITLPAKHPGVGKRLTVQEVRQDENKK